MHKHPLFITWSLLLLGIAILHIVAIELYLYWLYGWFDIFMHFLGGLFVGLSVLWLFFESGYITLSKHIRTITLVTLISFALIGISWEIFQYSVGLFIGKENAVVDTSVDLLVGLIGALIARWLYINLFINNTHELYEK